MRKIFLAAAMAAVAAPTVPAVAQSDPGRSEQQRDVRAADQEHREDLHDADNPRKVRKAQREHARHLAKADRNARQANRGWR